MDQLQLYLNDQLVDLSDDSPIALTFQINDLAEVQNQQSVATLNQTLDGLLQKQKQLSESGQQNTKVFQDMATQIKTVQTAIDNHSKAVDNSIKAISSSAGKLLAELLWRPAYLTWAKISLLLPKRLHLPNNHFLHS
jgi:hypothetical protein